MKKAWVLSYPFSAQRRLWSDWADAQADLSLRWAHNHFVGFVISWLKYSFSIIHSLTRPLGIINRVWSMVVAIPGLQYSQQNKLWRVILRLKYEYKKYKCPCRIGKSHPMSKHVQCVSGLMHVGRSVCTKFYLTVFPDYSFKYRNYHWVKIRPQTYCRVVCER